MEKRLSTILVTMFCIAIGIVFIALVSINSFGLNNFTNPVIGQSYSDFENKIVFFDLDTFIKDKSINERYDYLKLAFALQGLVNRQQPLIYYKYTSGSLDGGSDNFWLQEIQQEGKTFEDYTIIRYDSIYDLINLAKSLNAVSGVVIWDSNVPATANVASTIAGVENRLPIRYDNSTCSVYTDIITNKKLFTVDSTRNLVNKFKNITCLPDANLGAVSSCADALKSSGSAKNDAYLWAKKYYLDTKKTSNTIMAYTRDSWMTKCTQDACFDSYAPLYMKTNEEKEVYITVLNNTSTTWKASDLYRVAAISNVNKFTVTAADFGFEQGTNASQARLYLNQNNNVTPGKRLRIKFTIKAPSTAGSYNLSFGVVHDGVAWLSGNFSRTIEVSTSSSYENAENLYDSTYNYYSTPDSDISKKANQIYKEMFNSGINSSDYQIQNKAFFFDLSPLNAKPIDDTGQTLGTDLNTFKSILAKQKENNSSGLFTVIGFVPWYLKYATPADPNAGTGAVGSEWSFVELISTYGGQVDADAVSPAGGTNASFLKYYQLKSSYTQKNDKAGITSTAINKERYDSNTYYYMLFVGDFDSGAWANNLYASRFRYNADTPIDKYPLLWPIATDLSVRYPQVYDWLYENQRANDYFVTADNGSGYFNLTKAIAANSSFNTTWKNHNNTNNQKFDLDVSGFLLMNFSNITATVMQSYASMTPTLVAYYNNNTLDGTNPTNNTPFVPLANADPTADSIYSTILSAPSSKKYIAIRTVQLTRKNLYELIEAVDAKAKSNGKKFKIIDPYTMKRLYINSTISNYKGCYLVNGNYKWVNSDTLPTNGTYIAELGTHTQCEKTKTKLTKPTMTTSEYNYNGNYITPVISNFDSSTMDIIGTSKALNVGTYYTTISLKDKTSYTWSDNSIDDITISWKIKKHPYTMPTMATKTYVYNGTTITPNLGQFDTSLIPNQVEVIGTGSAKKAGKYKVAYKIKDFINTQWSIGNTKASPLILNFQWEITKASLTKPTLQTNTFTYTGSDITPTITGFDSNTMTISGDTSKKDVGQYSITISLKDIESSSWTDNSTNSITLTWSITKAKLTKPTLANDTFEYDGSIKTPIIIGFDSDTMDISGDESSSEVGNYTITIGLKDIDNYSWIDDTTYNVLLSWSIISTSPTITKLNKPTISNDTFTYDGSTKTPVISGYDSNTMNMTGTSSAINAGNYTITISLKDINNYSWSDGSISNITLSWSIAKIKLTKPALNTNSFTYDGSIKTPTINYYDSITMNKSGNESAQDAGNYTITISLKDKTNYSWGDNTTSNILLNWSIAKLIFTKPTLSPRTYTYDGEVKTPTLTGYNSAYMTKSGPQSATNAGTYNVVIGLKDTYNYSWSDDTTADITYTWTISRVVLDKPTISPLSYTYDGNTKTPTITGFDSTYMTKSGTESGVNANTYQIIIGLKDNENYVWSDGSILDLVYNWTINEASIEGGVTVSGTMKWDETLTATPRCITPNGGCTFSEYQWYYNSSSSTNDGVPIQNANESTYKIGKEYVGKYIYVKVKASSANYTDQLLESVPRSVVAKKDLSVTTTNYNSVYDGNAHGAKIKVISEYWNGELIESGTSTSYGQTVTSMAEVNTEYTLLPTYTNVTSAKTVYYKITGGDYYNDKTGSATVTITKANITGNIVVSGSTKWGQTLTASATCTSPNSGCTFSNYQWYATNSNTNSGGSQISGATSNTYTIEKEYAGKYIYATVTASKENYNNATLTSTQTSQIQKQDLNVTVTNYNNTYDASSHGPTVKVTSEYWNGRTIVSGTSTSYGQSVTTNGSANNLYTLKPTLTNVGEQTVYYKVTGGDYYNDKTGSATVTISSSVHAKPSLSTTSYEYTGNSISPVINNFDSAIMNKTGDTSATNAGNYSITVSLKDKVNYTWNDGTTTDIVLNWTINEVIPEKTALAKPTLKTSSFTYTASAITPTINGFDSSTMSLSGNVSATNVGNYTITVSLKDKVNYEWNDGTQSDLTFTWYITKAKLTKPTLSTSSFTYTSDSITPTINNYNSTTMSKSGSTSATNVNDYTITISLKDKNNYSWSDDSTSNLTLEWHITKAKLEKPTIMVTSYTYTGLSISPIVNGFDSSLMSKLASVDEINVGNYTLEIGLKDKNNYSWTDNSTTNVSLNWSINSAPIVGSVEIEGSTKWGSKLTANAVCATPSSGCTFSNYEWYYSSTSSNENGIKINGATSREYTVDKEYTGKFIYVKVTAESENYTDTVLTSNITNVIEKQDLNVTVTAYSGLYDGTPHGATIEITSPLWDGKTIVSGTSTSYGQNVTTNGTVDTVYTLLPTYTNVISNKTIYYKITGGNYYNDKTGSANVSIANANIEGSVLISGTAKWGQTLTATPTCTSPNSGCTFSNYQWYYSNTSSNLSGIKISGATSNTYTIEKEFVGKYIYVTVDATKANYNTTTLKSNQTSVIQKQDLSVITTNYNSIYDGVSHGAKIKVTSEYWNGELIKSGTSTSYTETVTSMGEVNTEYTLLPTYTDVTSTKTVYYKVTGGDYYNDKTGSATLTITKATITGNVAVSGTAKWGETLTAAATCTNVSNCTFSNYQWYYSNSNTNSGGTKISGATTNTYTIAKEYASKYIYVKVTASNENYDNVTLTSTQTNQIQKQDLSVTVTNYNDTYDGHPHGATVKVTSASWNGKTIVSGTSTSYGQSVTTNGSTNTEYTLKPTLTNIGEQTVYYKVTGGSYYNDKTGSATLSITKANIEGNIVISGNTKWGSKLTAAATCTTPSSGCTFSNYEWYYSNTATTNNGTKINGATTNTYTIEKEYTGKYIYVKVTASNANFNNATFTSAPTSQIQKQDLNVTETNYNSAYDGTSHGARVKVTSEYWNGKVINSGTNTNYTESVTTNGVVDTTYELKPAFTSTGEQTVYYKVIGGDYYNDKTGSATVVITKSKLAKPTMSTNSYTYTSSQIIPTINGFNSSTMNSSGDVNATNVGNYTITVSLKDKVNYEWNDGSTNDITFNYSITKAKLTKPTLENTTYTYTGSLVTPTINGFDSTHMTKSGNVSETNVGNYTLEISLKDKDNYSWNDGTTTNVSLNWSISNATIIGSVEITGTAKWGQTLTATATCTTPSSGCTFSNYEWYYSDTATNSGGTKINGATTNTYTIAKEYSSKYIYVKVTASKVNYGSVTLTSTPTNKIQKQDLNVTTINYNSVYDGNTHGAIVKVTSEYWNGKVINSGINTNYTESVTTNGSSNTEYTLKPAFTNVGEQTVYYKVTGGDYYNDKTGSATVTITKTKLTKPTLSTVVFEYTGSSINPVINSFDSTIMNKTGDTSATSAGNYTITVSLKDKVNYEWSDGSTSDIVLNWSINQSEPQRSKLEKPTLKSSSFTYTGSLITPTFNGFDSSTMSLGGNVNATNVGNYTITVSLKDKVNYEWIDGTQSDLTFNYSITKAKLEKPTIMVTSYTYTGLSISPIVNGFDSTYMTKGGTISEVEVGYYSLEISIKDKTNYEWNDGSSNNLTFIWHITKAKLEKPTIMVTSYTYTGLSISPIINGFDSTYMTKSGNVSEINTGNYTLEIVLKDKNNYSWTDDTTSNVLLDWSINSVSITGDVEITGTSIWGSKLTATPSCTTPSNGCTFSNYEWYYSDTATNTNGTKINGAISSEYTIAKEYTGKYIYVKVTASKENYSNAILTSTQTTQVQKQDLSVTVTPYSGVYDGNAHGARVEVTSEYWNGKVINSGTNTNYTETVTTTGVANTVYTLKPTYTSQIEQTVYYKVTGGDYYNDKTGNTTVTITRKTYSKPTLSSETYEYTGSSITPSLIGYNANYMSKSGDKSATNAGEYTLVISLKDKNNYSWTDGITTDIMLNWSIVQNEVQKTKLNKPTMSSNSFTYTGSLISPSLSGYDTNTMNITGSTNGTSVNNYTFIVSLKDKENYEWNDGTTSNITFNWSITKAKLTKPTMSANSFTYTGSQITPTINGFDSTHMVKSGNVNATNVGNYNITISLKDKNNYSWVDDTDSNVVLNYSITKVKLIKPTLNTTSYTYTASSYKPTINNYNSTYMNISGSLEETNAGNYTIIVSLKDKNNYSWSDESEENIELSWTILKAKLAKPSITTTEYLYTGSEITPVINNYDSSKMNKIGDQVATNAGNYSVTVVIKDKTNYSWLDNSINDITFNYSVTKAKLTKPTLSTTSFTYDGKVHEVTLKNSDSSKMTIGGCLSKAVAGNYEVIVELKDKNNYTWSDGTTSNLSLAWKINKANISPKVTISNYYEGNSASKPSVSGNSGNGVVTYEYSIKGENNYSKTPPTKVGEYTLRATISATDNYNGSTATTTFKVLKKTTPSDNTPKKSNDSTLKSLETDSGTLTPGFTKNNKKYSMTIDFTETREVTFETNTNNKNAKVKSNTCKIPNDTSIKSIKCSIVVTAEDSTKSEYVITIKNSSYEEPQKETIHITSIENDADATLNPEFNSDIYKYEMNLDFEYYSSVKFDVKTSDSNTTVKGNVCNIPSDSFEQSVTCNIVISNKSEKKTYTITINNTHAKCTLGINSSIYEIDHENKTIKVSSDHNADTIMSNIYYSCGTINIEGDKLILSDGINSIEYKIERITPNTTPETNESSSINPLYIAIPAGFVILLGVVIGIKKKKKE